MQHLAKNDSAALKNRWHALCEDSQLPSDIKARFRDELRGQALTPIFLQTLFSQRIVSKYREIIRKHFPRTLHILEFIAAINQTIDDNELVSQRESVFNDLLEEYKFFEVNDEDHKRLFRRIESNAEPAYLNLSLEQLSQLNRAYPQYGLLINEIDTSNCLVTSRRRATSQAIAVAEDDDEQDASTSSSSYEAASTQIHAHQLSGDLALNPKLPLDKNLLDACLNYTGLHLSITSNHVHSALIEREDGSEAYKHTLLIAASENVGQTSLGKLKTFPQLNAHLNLNQKQKQNIFERIAYQKAGASNVSYKWQCVDPDVTVSASELALLPRDCAVGTVVITRSTASRVAHNVLASGGAVPAYRAAHEAKKQTQAKSTTTQSAAVSRQRSSVPTFASSAGKNTGMSTSRKRKSTPDESEDNVDDDNERSEEAADNEATAQRPLRAGITLNLKDPYDQCIADGCLAYTGLNYAVTSVSVLANTIKRQDGSDVYKHVVLISPPEITTTRKTVGEVYELFRRMVTHFPLIPAQKRNVFLRIPGNKIHSQRSAPYWTCADLMVKMDPETEDLLPRDCPVGSVVIVRTTAHVFAHAILAPDVIPQSYRDAFNLKQQRGVASSNATTSQTTHQATAAHQATSTLQSTTAKKAKTATHAAAPRFSAPSQPAQQVDVRTANDNSDDRAADVFPQDDEMMSQSATRPAAKAQRPSTHTTQTSDAKRRSTQTAQTSYASNVSTQTAQTSRVVGASTSASALTTSNAATTPLASTFGQVMQTLTPADTVDAVPQDVLAQLSAFADDELPADIQDLLRQAREQKEQIEREKQAIAETANVALRAYIEQQRQSLAAVQQKRARLDGGLFSPQQTSNSAAKGDGPNPSK